MASGARPNGRQPLRLAQATTGYILITFYSTVASRKFSYAAAHELALTSTELAARSADVRDHVDEAQAFTEARAPERVDVEDLLAQRLTPGAKAG